MGMITMQANLDAITVLNSVNIEFSCCVDAVKHDELSGESYAEICGGQMHIEHCPCSI
uniref:Uncharacterized protein n=1 Tax=Arundo donax TaxID=35708 RepID=A0A0A9H2C3_ARUDO